MLDKKEFGKIRKEMRESDRKREVVIQKSREMINLSKRIIYALHRHDTKTASKLLKEISKKKNELGKTGRHDVNIDTTALQEYVEAAAYHEFLTNKKIPTKTSLRVDNETYLMGLCDLTGELVRKAVQEAINQHYQSVVEIKGLVEEIYEEFLKFNLRNSELRKKSDQIKWNLKKLEDLTYDLKIKGKLAENGI